MRPIMIPVAITMLVFDVPVTFGFQMTFAAAVAIFDLIVGSFLQICSMIAPTVTMAAAFAAAFATALAFGESGFELWGELIVKADGRGAQSGADKAGYCQGTKRNAGAFHRFYSDNFSPVAQRPINQKANARPGIVPEVELKRIACATN